MPNIWLDEETMANLKTLAEKSGYSMIHLLRELGKLNEMIPDNADRISLGIFPKFEQRSILFITAPIYVGKLPECKNSVSDAEVDKQIKKALFKKVNE